MTVPREVARLRPPDWVCLDCGRARYRDDVFVTDAGPVCRDRDDCYRARDEDDQDDYRPHRDDRAPE